MAVVDDIMPATGDSACAQLLCNLMEHDTWCDKALLHTACHAWLHQDSTALRGANVSHHACRTRHAAHACCTDYVQLCRLVWSSAHNTLIHNVSASRYTQGENASAAVKGVQVVAAVAASGQHAQGQDQLATIMVSKHVFTTSNC